MGSVALVLSERCTSTEQWIGNDMTITLMQDKVLLVVGSIKDKHLGYGKWTILDGGGIPKTVRVSRQEFLVDFHDVLLELGIANLEGIVEWAVRGGHRVLPSYRAIAYSGGRIGAIMMDQSTWAHTRGGRKLYSQEVIAWMLTNDGRIGRLPR